jgi:hypothetical protein
MTVEGGMVGGHSAASFDTQKGRRQGRGGVLPGARMGTSAPKVLWRHASLPRMRHGFDSRWPLHK